jgi:hypothetical protein
MIHAVKAIVIATLVLGSATVPIEAQRLSDSRKALALASIPRSETAPQRLDRKNAVLAGSMSAILAGTGSYYAGDAVHGARHSSTQLVAVLFFTIGKTWEWRECFHVFEPEDPNCGSGGKVLYSAALAVGVVNGIWSVFTAVADARAYNEKRRREGS